MSASYGSHVLHSLQRFINAHNSYIAEHDAKLKMLEHRLTAIESAKQAPAQVAECVKAMEEAYDMLDSIYKVNENRLLNVRWNDPIDIQVMRVLRTAIKQAKGE